MVIERLRFSVIKRITRTASKNLDHIYFLLLKYNTKEAPKVHVVSCSSAVAISHKWHHENLAIKYSYSISKLLGSFASDGLLRGLFRKLRLLVVGHNFLLEFVIRCCLSICCCNNTVFRLHNNLSPIFLYLQGSATLPLILSSLD